ncbi:MAG: hypothetical protein II345_04470, partial [Alistipes sp.]|nr:hypothetical protein [Alistipes sp.]
TRVRLPPPPRTIEKACQDGALFPFVEVADESATYIYNPPKPSFEKEGLLFDDITFGALFPFVEVARESNPI